MPFDVNRLGAFGMMFKTRRDAAALVLFVAWLLAPAVQAADVGGFYADQQKAREMAAQNAGAHTCPKLIARAAQDDTALAAYRAALCYLQAEPPEVVAAKA